MAVPQSRWSRPGGDLFRSIPVTTVIIGIWLLSFLFSVAESRLLVRLFIFDPRLMPNIITGLFTYPLAMGNDILGLIFGGLILYWFGGSLERAWGTRTYLLFLLGSSVAAAVIWQLGLLIVLHGLLPMADPWMLLSSVIVAWAWLNPDQTILLYFVLPVKAKWLGWLTIALLFFTYPGRVSGLGVLTFFLGFFALGGIAFAYLFDWYLRKWAWIPRRRSKSRAIRHPSSTIWGTLTRPYREWQRRRRVAHLQRTIRFDD